MMSISLDWLPKLCVCEDLKKWADYEDQLYTFFDRDFLLSQPKLNGKAVRLRPHGVLGGKNRSFWHLISVDDNSDALRAGERLREIDRVPDFARCERIAWPRAIIEHAGDDVVRWQKLAKTKQHGTDRRLLIALRDFSYLVVLSIRADHYLLVTAYPVERQQQRDALRREYEASGEYKAAKKKAEAAQ